MHKARFLFPVLLLGCGRVTLDDATDARPVSRDAQPVPVVDASPDGRLLPDGRIPDPPTDGGANCFLWDFTLEAPTRTSELYYDQARLVGGPAEYLVVHRSGIGVDDEVLDSNEHVTLNAAYPKPDGSGVEGTVHAWRLVPVTSARVEYFVEGSAEPSTVRIEPDATGWLQLDVEARWSTVYPDSPTVVSAVEFCRPVAPPSTPALGGYPRD